MDLVHNLNFIPFLLCFSLAMVLQPFLANLASGQN